MRHDDEPLVSIPVVRHLSMDPDDCVGVLKLLPAREQELARMVKEGVAFQISMLVAVTKSEELRILATSIEATPCLPNHDAEALAELRAIHRTMQAQGRSMGDDAGENPKRRGAECAEVRG